MNRVPMLWKNKSEIAVSVHLSKNWFCGWMSAFKNKLEEIAAIDIVYEGRRKCFEEGHLV